MPGGWETQGSLCLQGNPPGGGTGEEQGCLSEVWEVVPLSQQNHESILSLIRFLVLRV